MITVKINTVDQSDKIVWESLIVKQNLTYLVDTAQFSIRKYGSRTLQPEFDDDIEILDGATKIFGGKVLSVIETVESGGGGVVYTVKCVDHTNEFDRLLISKTYTSTTVEDIIFDIVDNEVPSGFTRNNVSANFAVDKIVFNQVPASECLKRLADLIRYDWYIDPDKDVHFFSKEINSAPFNLTDISGNFVYKSLKRNVDGSQLVNQVKVRGGEYEGSSYTDTITVSGDASKSFKLPYKFGNLEIELDTGGGFVSQQVGIDFIDDFGVTVDVLYNYQDQSFRFENALADGDLIKFTGNPKVRVFAIAQDSDSVAEYGIIEKLIRDNSIVDNGQARDRANAELLAYAEEMIDASFKTYDSGLRTGQLINVQSTRRASDDDLLIKTVTFKPTDPNNFIYQVDCITTKRLGLIETLQKLLGPEPLDIDESETSESIFATNEKVTISEDIDFITPVEADETVSVAENILLDPVEPANVRFVLGPYTPSSQSDTKRPGRLGISFITY